MKLAEALRTLAELTSHQWGMVTSAQASMHGISRLALSRLTAAGQLTRLAHGVYMDAGAPGDQLDDLRAAWLSTDPDQLAEDRIKHLAAGVVIAGASAAQLHGIGDLRAPQYDFVSPTRRQTQRKAVRYRQRVLDPRDITVVAGLPAMSLERTIADLVEDIGELSLVADALRDAAMTRRLDLPRLQTLLSPLAARHGFDKDDGAALLARLLQLAGLDVDSLARQIASSPTLGTLAEVARQVANVG